MDRVTEEEIGCRRRVGRLPGQVPAAIARAESVGPGPEKGPPAQGARALERLDREEPRRVLHEVTIREKQERREGHQLGEGRRARTSVEPDRTPAVGEIEGDEPRARVPAEEKRSVLDGEHAPSIPANAYAGDVVSCRFLET